MRNLIVIIILFTIFFSSCNNDSSNPTSTTSINNSYLESPYKGNWNVTFKWYNDTTQIICSGSINIRTDGSFTNNLTNSTTTYVFSGDAQNNGQLSNGKLFRNGSSVGDISGIFIDNSGSGLWKITSGSSTTTYATWRATR